MERKRLESNGMSRVWSNFEHQNFCAAAATNSAGNNLADLNALG